MATNTKEPSLLLTPKQSAEYIGVSLRRYYGLRASGQLPPPVRLGDRTVLQRRADLDAFVESLPSGACIPEPEQLVNGKRRKVGA